MSILWAKEGEMSKGTNQQRKACLKSRKEGKRELYTEYGNGRRKRYVECSVNPACRQQKKLEKHVIRITTIRFAPTNHNAHIWDGRKGE
jgi:hypothetical protein